jgi:hypothetical protein
MPHASMSQASYQRPSADPVFPYSSQPAYSPQSSYSPEPQQNPSYPSQASYDSQSVSQSSDQQPGSSSQSASERPALPKRQAQAILSAQLGEEDGTGWPPVSSPGGNAPFRIPGAASEEPADQMPGLMADFLRGVSQSTDDPYEDGTPFRD